MVNNVIEQMVDYSRQESMIDDTARVRIFDRAQFIVGCGGIGFWTGIFLAMMGCNRFTLVDADRVESTNLPRLPVPLRFKGKFKIHTLKLIIRLLRPTVRITCIPMAITEDNISQISFNHDMVWDCTDDARIQKIIARVSAEREFYYYKMSYEGWEVAGYSRIQLQSLWIDDTYRAGYTTNSSNVLSSVMASALGIIHVMTSTRFGEYKINIKELVQCRQTAGQ